MLHYYYYYYILLLLLLYIIKPHLQGNCKANASKVDQENLEEKIKGWKQENPEDLFFFSPCSLSPTESVSHNSSDTDTNVEAHLLKTSYLCIKHLGRGI